MKYNRSNQNVAASVEMEVRAKNKVIWGSALQREITLWALLACRAFLNLRLDYIWWLLQSMTKLAGSLTGSCYFMPVDLSSMFSGAQMLVVWRAFSWKCFLEMTIANPIITCDCRCTNLIYEDSSHCNSIGFCLFEIFQLSWHYVEGRY
jgi:hypothetical protein